MGPSSAVLVVILGVFTSQVVGQGYNVNLGDAKPHSVDSGLYQGGESNLGGGYGGISQDAIPLKQPGGINIGGGGGDFRIPDESQGGGILEQGLIGGGGGYNSGPSVGLDHGVVKQPGNIGGGYGPSPVVAPIKSEPYGGKPAVGYGDSAPTLIQPGYGQPQVQPGYGNPQVQPGYGKPQVQPGYGQPQVQPGYGQPQIQPGYGKPQVQSGYGQPQVQPGYGGGKPVHKQPVIFRPDNGPGYGGGPAVRPHGHGHGHNGYGPGQHRQPQAYPTQHQQQPYGRPQVPVPSHNNYNVPSMGWNSGYGSPAVPIAPVAKPGY